MTAIPATVVLDNPETAKRAATPLHLPVQRRTELSLRARVAAAFREGNGRDESTAYGRTKEWYCASGGEWTRGLS